MSISTYWGGVTPQEAEVGDLWLDTTLSTYHHLKVKCATEWVPIATLTVDSEPHTALFNRIMVESDA